MSIYSPDAVSAVINEGLLDRYQKLVEELLDALNADEQFDLWNRLRKEADEISQERFG